MTSRFSLVGVRSVGYVSTAVLDLFNHHDESVQCVFVLFTMCIKKKNKSITLLLWSGGEATEEVGHFMVYAALTTVLQAHDATLMLMQSDAKPRKSELSVSLKCLFFHMRNQN